MNHETSTADLLVCPECAAGKHPNCDGATWDPIEDRPTTCECPTCGPDSGNVSADPPAREAGSAVTENQPTSETFRIDDTLPALYIPWPRCDHCDNEVEIEDGYATCTTCLIEWDNISESAGSKPDSAREGTEVPCEIVSGSQGKPHDDARGVHYEPGPPLPCILPSGHTGPHLCPYDVTVTRRFEASR